MNRMMCVPSLTWKEMESKGDPNGEKRKRQFLNYNNNLNYSNNTYVHECKYINIIYNVTVFYN